MLRTVRVSSVTTLLGALNLSFQVPGTYGGLTPLFPTFQGRQIIKMELFFGTPLAGDQLISLQVIDSGSVIPVPFRSQFPSYPVIKDWADPGLTSSNYGIYLPLADIYTFTPVGAPLSCPSELYLSITGQKATAVIDHLYVNIYWDDFM